jgi:hypothetical protein
MNVLVIILLQAITMFQPEAIVQTGEGTVVAVETEQTETRVSLRFTTAADSWPAPATMFLSDEADDHHALRSSHVEDSILDLTFAALPPPTRASDIRGDDLYR